MKSIRNSCFLVFVSSKLLHRAVGVIIIACGGIVCAQGVEAPPMTSFKPDTSLPKVSVPEFVITGKAQVDVARFSKESTEIDSSYFQRKTLAGLRMDMPISQSLSLQSSTSQWSNLFSTVSTGTYSTTSYLLSGNGEFDKIRLNGNMSGFYTSGFTPQTIRRDISIQAGIAKDIEVDQGAKTFNSAAVGYSRTSFFLYGTGIPDLLRTTNLINVGLHSDMNLGSFPLTAGLTFNGFSAQDYWKDVQNAVSLNLGTIFQMPSGNMKLSGVGRFGNHDASIADTLISLHQINHSFYNAALGLEYSNNIGDFSYSIGMNYFQYADDLSIGIAKLYPDLRGTYRVNDLVSLFTRFYGDVESPDLSTFFNENQYVDADFPLRNSQIYADFTIGGDWIATQEILVTPKINIDASRYYPIFAGFPFSVIGADTNRADIQLLYANKATVLTASIVAQYKKDKFSADAALNIRSGTADSLRSIPNLDPFDLTIGGNYEIIPRFDFRAYVFVLSGRYSDLALKSRLSSVWLLNFHLSYDLKLGRIPLEIFADGKNVLDQRYYIWRGYQEFPIAIFIGLKSKIL